jgi:hypothetical protein
MALHQANVVVGIGCQEIWDARNLPFDVAWVCIPHLATRILCPWSLTEND